MKVTNNDSYTRPVKGALANLTDFQDNYENIFKCFANGYSSGEVAEEFGVTIQAACKWKKHWLAAIDFMDEPPKIIQMKKDAATKIGRRTASGIIDSKQKKVAYALKVSDINMMRLKGLNIIDLGMDRIIELINKEKSVKSIASVLSALLPYVAVRADMMGDKGTPLDAKKATFIQNILNVYHNPQKEIQDETIEDVEPERDTEE